VHFDERMNVNIFNKKLNFSSFLHLSKKHCCFKHFANFLTLRLQRKKLVSTETKTKNGGEKKYNPQSEIKLSGLDNCP
jgi:hypothetical protein